MEQLWWQSFGKDYLLENAVTIVSEVITYFVVAPKCVSPPDNFQGERASGPLCVLTLPFARFIHGLGGFLSSGQMSRLGEVSCPSWVVCPPHQSIACLRFILVMALITEGNDLIFDFEKIYSLLPPN